MIGVDPEVHLGAYIRPEYELRVTERCLTVDLGLGADTSFDTAASTRIVSGFRTKRASNPGDGETIGPAAGDRSLYKLRSGRHRGATLFDEIESVVWLCACGFHESGQADDAYRLFDALIDSGEIYPAAADHLRLHLERRRRFRDLVGPHCDGLVRQALGTPNQTVEARLGRELPTRLTASLDGDLIDITVAFPAQVIGRVYKTQMPLALAAIGGTSNPDLQAVGEIGGRPLSDEVAFRLYRSP